MDNITIAMGALVGFVLFLFGMYYFLRQVFEVPQQLANQQKTIELLSKLMEQKEPLETSTV